MNTLTKQDKLHAILKVVESQDLTAYELSKQTGLNESGLNRLLKKKIANPHLATIDKLYEYLLGSQSTKNRNIQLRLSQIKTLEDVTNFIIDFESYLAAEVTPFKLWLKTKHQEGAIKMLAVDKNK